MADGQKGLESFSQTTAEQVQSQEISVKEGQTVYSHSRISTFENCPLAFKFNYIDDLETDVENTVEAFLGSMVHLTLEKLYQDMKFQKHNSLQELLHHFNDEWKKNWNDKILIVRHGYEEENFRKMGVKFITEYFNRYQPFDQGKTIGLEMRIMIKLDQQGHYVLQGYIDRLTDLGDGVYEIHDYKTANTLPEQEKIDADRQLALYSIAVKEKYRDCRKVVLIWHYLAFDKELRSERTDEQLQKLKEETVSMIKKIEASKEFPPKESALCGWCAFRQHCPNFAHLYQLEKKEPEQFLKDDGVRLVNEFAALKVQEKELSEKLEELNSKIFSYSEQHKVDKLYGSEVKVTVWKKSCVRFPGKPDDEYAHFVKVLRDSGIYDQYSTVDKWRIEKAWDALEIPPPIMERLARYGKKEFIRKLYVAKR